MKRILLTYIVGLLVHTAFGQVVVFHENFDAPSLADSVVSGANGNSVPWSLINSLQVSQSNSYHGTYAASDSSWVETHSFSTIGFNFVTLEFNHITKIEFFDFGVLYVSNDGGVNWTKLRCVHYLGLSNFCNNGEKFSSSGYLDWLPAEPSVIPNNGWWRHEIFNLSNLLTNSSNCKIRFLMYDSNFNGMGGNYGWLIDNIKVTASSTPFSTDEIPLSKFSLHPNPSAGEVEISINSLVGGAAQIEVVNFIGQTLYRFEEKFAADQNVLKYDLGGLASGVYYIRVNHGGHEIVEKLVISK